MARMAHRRHAGSLFIVKGAGLCAFGENGPAGERLVRVFVGYGT